ncbi:TPA: ABC transporter ATP-binding protein [Klebsiella quasipneumoniae subsp. similipneumoniae]|uniref:ABC transporter ATP-binding protein n=1 Tax=Klebsiella quasipneumoniae TaxID=1463165 RepID=UPI0002C40FEE|nr:sn-glycerol-3-phosphate ABC transporter ATP-binding protein UgpC [Klebsiella quasipneumoniae]AMR16582.1 ABC transporter [Klebsiella quasipneumoniae]AVF89961.1 sn-glycerol-3-phosphate ABC transporter ATP-binding protein UgpC [Klebsiella quasipneumoniae]AVR37212.1 ABC transporter [Klebsiella quasipneumoniae]AWO63300.1 sn-glycerol-3-phosphate ABC transporter ATP-binding protein UgpC [Klebsiella quasipneumoniae subsp. similipneumoniae]EIY5069798.1 sn-glycerol-3-phosphate ABC transporter ATP-bin
MASVELIDVAKRYGKQTVLQPLDLTIPDGSFTVLVGPSGCGKSTLLRLLAGLETLSGGTILMNQRPVNDLDPADRDVAMVFQSYALYPHLTVAENLAFHMQVKKVDKQLQKSKVQQVASLLGIDKLLARYPRALSGGQRQRVAMGRAMVRNPQVFLFDEPLSNLDAQLRMELRAEIKSLHQRINTTMIYVTHDQVEAMTLADQIVVMRDGQIVQQGAPLAIYDQPCNTFVARFIGSPPMNLLPGQRDVRNGQPGVACGALWFPLAERWHQAVANQGDAPLIVGLRPQDILPDAHGALATVNIMEVTGESTLLHLDWQGFPVHVQVAGRVAVAAQQTLGLTLRRENLHLFDAASGERLAETR